VSLDDGWTVVEPFPVSSGATGSTFSVSYRVARQRKDGSKEQAFLKALDLGRLVQAGHRLIDVIEGGVGAYRHERDIVLRCSERRMTNMVRGVGAGQVDVPVEQFDRSFEALATVPYLIFEVANGDVRAALEGRGAAFDEAWSLCMLHGVANGIRQLHEAGISHQDLKPSNVMTFGAVTAKVGDLGQACDSTGPSLWEDGRPGDPNYWPPELLYGFSFEDANVRRKAYDLYHLGSMAVFLISGSSLTALLHEDLEDEFHWRTWPRGYVNVQPYVRDSFTRILNRIGPNLSGGVRDPLIAAIRELCEPHPPSRGNPKRTDPGRYHLDRYVSIFNRLARTAEYELTRSPT
jgi:serine/threonine protein kinase